MFELLQVQSRMGLLPAEDIPLLDPLRDDHASILGLVKVCRAAGKFLYALTSVAVKLLGSAIPSKMAAACFVM